MTEPEIPEGVLEEKSEGYMEEKAETVAAGIEETKDAVPVSAPSTMPGAKLEGLGQSEVNPNPFSMGNVFCVDKSPLEHAKKDRDDAW